MPIRICTQVTSAMPCQLPIMQQPACRVMIFLPGRIGSSNPLGANVTNSAAIGCIGSILSFEARYWSARDLQPGTILWRYHKLRQSRRNTFRGSLPRKGFGRILLACAREVPPAVSTTLKKD